MNDNARIVADGTYTPPRTARSSSSARLWRPRWRARPAIRRTGRSRRPRSDRVIWSPDVPVHRGDDGELLREPYPVSFLTCPAPNTGEALRRDPAVADRIPEVLRRRARRVLAVAAHHGARRLVLGAWGCGVFRNDPRQVAEAFHAHLAAGGEFSGVFEQVVFAVWDRNPDSANRAAFAACFAAETGAGRPA
ncbi:TIGR02452 family protein [Nonomuraea jabiensis]|uniref:TIGR02452 family protein n=1 Tax=Nonomuraea jabiensis TaxID=882448 RepID=UPI003423110B